MAAHSPSQPRRLPRRAPPPPAANGKASTSSKPTSPVQESQERTVKKLRLTRALTLPEPTDVSDACRRMAARRLDAALLTDTNGMLSGIITAEDIAGRVIAEGLKPEETSVAKVMTRNPVFVMSNTSAIEALQEMFKGPQGFMESLREQMFKPSLSTIITENRSVPVVSPSDPVILAAKKMKEHRVNSVVVMTGTSLLGIITSKDLVLRVLAHNLSPDTTLVEKAMTANPDCATLDTSILEALHSMQDGKFLHIPVMDKNGQIVACLDALQLTHAAISMVEGGSGANDVANTMIHKFWDSALAMHPSEDFDAHSDESHIMTSDNSEGKHIQPPHINSLFCFKIEDQRGHVHKFNCVSESLDELVSAVSQRLGMDHENFNIKLLYDDDEGDRVVLANDSDLTAAIQHAKSAGWKVLRLHADKSETTRESIVSPGDPSPAQRRWHSLWFGVAAGAVVVAGVGVVVYLKRSQL